jgi:hypothetical protein
MSERKEISMKSTASKKEWGDLNDFYELPVPLIKFIMGHAWLRFTKHDSWDREIAAEELGNALLACSRASIDLDGMLDLDDIGCLSAALLNADESLQLAARVYWHFGLIGSEQRDQAIAIARDGHDQEIRQEAEHLFEDAFVVWAKKIDVNKIRALTEGEHVYH